MSKKDSLMQYQNKIRQAEILKYKIEMIRSVAERTTARMDDALNRIEDECRRVEDEAIAARVEILSAISSVENPDALRILTLRYIHGLKWKTIAEQMYRSERNVLAIHKKALDKLDCG